jgi:TolA-binding protein
MVLGGVGISIAACLAAPPAICRAADGAPPQLSAEEAAVVKLNAGRRAFNEKNYDVAINVFREFLASNGGSHEAPIASYGLGLCLLQHTPLDYKAAAEAFARAAAAQDLADRPLVLYDWGVALRGLGIRASADAIARPNEADSLRRSAAQNYEEAAKQFSAARTAFDQRGADAAPATNALPSIDQEWSARARCDAAEMLLRLGKFKEALDASIGFESDPILAKSRYRPLALYHVGYAQFALRDYLSAGRSLSQLAPFGQDFGLHARYLLGRVHHLCDERPEAAAQYKAVIEEYDARKKSAQRSLQNPAALDPRRREELEAIANGPPGDYVGRAAFYSAVLQYENGHYPEAAEAFKSLVERQPKSDLAPEARLRLGFCYLQSARPKEAIDTLASLIDNKDFGDRALWWTARARIAAADPANPDAPKQAAVAAIDTLRRAADLCRQRAAVDPDAKVRRVDIMIELADTQQFAKKYREAAATYQQILNEEPKSDRAEKMMQRRVTALHLAGQFQESDGAGELFLKTFPKSTLTPAVLFRQAENLYLTALAAADDKNPKPRPEQEKLFSAAVVRYQAFLAKYPDFDYADLAKQGLATCQARLGHYADAIAVLLTIPESNRSGELATIPYLLADCNIRTFPAEADDALTAERLIESAEDAAKLLESFLGAAPKSPQAPDALLKLGYCYQRIASQLAIADERQKTLVNAREAYERAIQQFPNDPSAPSVIFERARVMAMMGDIGGAQNELRRFQNDPLKSTPNAPLALVRLSVLLRSQNQPDQAADVMKRCRETCDGPLAADPARADWLPMLKYEQASALQDLHKLPEARTIFEEIVKHYPANPEGVNACWRVAQCRRQEAAEKVAEARAVANRPGAGDSEIATVYAHAQEPLKGLSVAAELLSAQTDAQAARSAGSPATARMLYELAWCYRTQADADSDADKMKMARETADRMRSRFPGASAITAAAFFGSSVSLAQLPPPASEQKAREYYQRLIFAGPATELACQARFEMAELLSQRGQTDAVLDLLTTALENQPSKPLAQRIKVRVAAALLAKNNPQSALAQVTPMLDDKETPVAAEARYLAGEAHIQQQDWKSAIETLLPFRDQDPYRNAPGIADRALARLGFAMAQSGQWEPSRMSFEALVGRFGQSPWIDDARFGMGWALQNQKRYDEAVNVYTELTRHSAAESAARAQVNIGVCRLEQRRPADALKALLAVPLTYDYPDCSAAAWYQAAQAQLQSEKPQEAAKLLNRVMKEYPTTSWASLAQRRLAEIK